MKKIRYFIIFTLILSFLPATSTFGQKKTRAGKKKEKAELLDQEYESMKKLVHSGSYNFTAYKCRNIVKNGTSFPDILSEPNYFTIRNGKYSFFLSAIFTEKRTSTGEISDLKIIENDNNHTIQVEFSIYSQRKYQFTIMPKGRAELRLRKTILYGNIGPILK